LTPLARLEWRQRGSARRDPAQADFGEAIGIIGGVERKIHVFAFDLPHCHAASLAGWQLPEEFAVDTRASPMAAIPATWPRS
jgi:hypothetical protein